MFDDHDDDDDDDDDDVTAADTWFSDGNLDDDALSDGLTKIKLSAATTPATKKTMFHDTYYMFYIIHCIYI